MQVLISIRQIVNLVDNKRLMLLLAQSNLELEVSKKALEDKQALLLTGKHFHINHIILQ